MCEVCEAGLGCGGGVVLVDELFEVVADFLCFGCFGEEFDGFGVDFGFGFVLFFLLLLFDLVSFFLVFCVFEDADVFLDGVFDVLDFFGEFFSLFFVLSKSQGSSIRSRIG